MPGILRVLDPLTRVSVVFCQGQLHLVILEGWKTANVAANSCELCPEAAHGEPAESWEPIFIPPTPPNVLSIVSSFCVSIWSAYIPLIPHPEFFTSSWFNPPKMTGATTLLARAKRTSKTNNNPNPQGTHLHQQTTQTLSGGLYGILPTSQYFQQERSHDDPIDDQIFCDGAEWLGVLERLI